MDYIVSAIEMRELDRQTINHLAVPGRVLMEVAGRAVAEVCRQGLEEPGRIAVACGTGNNGGDGFVVARALLAHGHEIRTFIFGERNHIKEDARSALDSLEKLSAECIAEVGDAKALWEFSAFVDSADVVIDALLGTGLNKDVSGIIGEAIDVINDCHCPVVAVDIPSGVDSDTGAEMGRAVQATATVTFAFAKRGHYLYPGADLRGQLSIVDIGIPLELAEKLGVVGRVVESDDGANLMPARRGETHKGNYGHVVILAGSRETPGAAILALQGALRAGSGLVSWAADEATVATAPERPAEVMLRMRRAGEAVDAWAARVVDGATALVLGPGLSTETARAEELAAILEASEVPLCVDADGLNFLAAQPELWKKVKAPLVITPHPKEMARLTDSSVDDVQKDRFAAAGQLAMTRSCVVVLKGAGTVVAESDGAVAVIAAGNPGMATGGTGDVLAGVIGGFLAQGYDPAQAALAGTLLHSVAGDEAVKAHGHAGLRASDLVDAMGGVLASWKR